MLTVILSIDLLFHVPSHLPVLAAGVLDEVAHLFTTVLILRLVRYPLTKTFTVSCLLATLLLDIDHIPGLLGSQILTQGTARPYSHSVTTLVVLLLAAAVSRPGHRAVLLGATWGIVLHLLRDLATGRVAIWWPVSWENGSFPYALYASLMIASALVGSAWWQKFTARIDGALVGPMQEHARSGSD